MSDFQPAEPALRMSAGERQIVAFTSVAHGLNHKEAARTPESWRLLVLLGRLLTEFVGRSGAIPGQAAGGHVGDGSRVAA